MSSIGGKQYAEMKLNSRELVLLTKISTRVPVQHLKSPVLLQLCHPTEPYSYIHTSETDRVLDCLQASVPAGME